MWCLKLLFLFILYCQSSKTYYDILNVKSTASSDEIKQSYRLLAKKYHPDKNLNNPNAHDLFIEISKAYETLYDDIKRREYDMTMHIKRRAFASHKNEKASTSSKGTQEPKDTPHGSKFNDNTFMYRGKFGGSFYFQSKSSNSDDFFRQYFGEQYDSHQESFSRNKEQKYQYSINWYELFEIFHLLVSLAITLAVPITICLIVCSMVYHGVYNLFSSIVFVHQQQQMKNAQFKPAPIPNRNLHAYLYPPKEEPSNTDESRLTSAKKVFSSIYNILKHILFKTSKDINLPKNYQRMDIKSVDSEESLGHKTPERENPSKNPFETPSPISVADFENITPEDRAIERLRLRHLDERGVILVIALTIKGWNILTQLKPYFNHDKALHFLQHINGVYDLNMAGSDADILAVRSRGEKWTPFYLEEEEDEEEEDIHENEVYSRQISSPISSFNTNSTFDSDNPQSITLSPIKLDASEETSIDLGNSMDTSVDATEDSMLNVQSSENNDMSNCEDSIDTSWEKLRAIENRKDLEDWIVKLLNGEIPMKHVLDSPLPLHLFK